MFFSDLQSLSEPIFFKGDLKHRYSVSGLLVAFEWWNLFYLLVNCLKMHTVSFRMSFNVTEIDDQTI